MPDVQIVQQAGNAAAQEFPDGSLCFVHFGFGGCTRYADARDQLRHWYPKLAVGGIFSGDGYLDGIWEDAVYGVKTAVDEIAAAHGLQVNITLDVPPTWYATKPGTPRAPQPLDVALLTAHDANLRELAEYTTPNKEAYCARHGYGFVLRTEGFAPSRPPAWSKIRFIKESLHDHEWVFWSDADSLVMNASTRLESFVQEGCDLVLTHQDMGIGFYNVCTGHMLFRRSKWSMRFLDEVWSQRQFLRDRLWENRAVIHLLWSRDLSKHVRIVPQRRFNSYPCNYRKGDFILHTAGVAPAQRLPILQKYHQFAVPVASNV